MIARLFSTTRTLRLAGAIGFGLASTLASADALAQTATTDATTHITEGAKAAKTGDWTRALTEYTAANDATKSAAALQGIALAEYRLKHAGEAYDAYGELLSLYADRISAMDKSIAEARRKELAVHTGALTIAVNEPGAIVYVGERVVGLSPLAIPIRVASGPHTVRVTKAGFTPFSADITMADNAAASVSAKIEREATTGHVVVKEKSGQALRVVVDSVDVGATPWEGDVPPGPHDIAGRSSQLVAPAQHVDVARGKRVDVELVGVAQAGHLDVSTNDRQGVIYLDGRPVAEGVFAADLPAGTHVIAVTRDGFVRYEKTIQLADKQSLSETVTLSRPRAEAGVVKAPERANDGIYGGFGLVGLFEPGGEGNQIDTGCGALGAFSCSTPAPIGGAVFGYVGYSWNPIGLELMLGGEFDQSSPKADFNGIANGTQNPLAAGIAREEQFHFYRGGGIVAARVRLQWQNDRIRGAIAGGVGVAYKVLAMTRETTASQNGTPLDNVLSPATSSYFSPALSFDGSVQLRLTPTTAIMLGVTSWIESAEVGGIKSAPPQSQQFLGGGSQVPVAVATPAYTFASAAQVFIGPYIGMQFGP